MKRLYKIVNLDCKINGTNSGFSGDNEVTRALAKITYRPLLTNWPQSRRDDLFVIDNMHNRELAQLYWSMAEQAHLISPCGQLHFERIWCAGRDGLRVDIECGVVYIGTCLNWSVEYFRWWIENSDVGFDSWIDGSRFLADFGEAEISDDEIVMMKGPGYDIYGHWLLDYVPQLLLTKYMELAEGTTYVFDAMTDWIKSLIDAVGIIHTRTYQCRLSEHRNLTMPTGLNNGYALAQPINMVTWNLLRLHFNHRGINQAGPAPEKIYISRRNWSRQRSLANAEAVESLMQEFGFTVCYPEQHKLEEQARLFADARYVVGEDGSALHSLIFTRPGARLGVLMQADRMNLWHAGICDAMGHSLGYFEVSQSDGHACADLMALKAFVGELLAN